MSGGRERPAWLTNAAEPVVAGVAPGPRTLDPATHPQHPAAADRPDAATAELTQRCHHVPGQPIGVVTVGRDDDRHDAGRQHLDLAADATTKIPDVDVQSGLDVGRGTDLLA